MKFQGSLDDWDRWLSWRLSAQPQPESSVSGVSATVHQLQLSAMVIFIETLLQIAPAGTSDRFQFMYSTMVHQGQPVPGGLWFISAAKQYEPGKAASRGWNPPMPNATEDEHRTALNHGVSLAHILLALADEEYLQVLLKHLHERDSGFLAGALYLALMEVRLASARLPPIPASFLSRFKE